LHYEAVKTVLDAHLKVSQDVTAELIKEVELTSKLKAEQKEYSELQKIKRTTNDEKIVHAAFMGQGVKNPSDPNGQGQGGTTLLGGTGGADDVYSGGAARQAAIQAALEKTRSYVTALIPAWSNLTQKVRDDWEASGKTTDQYNKFSEAARANLAILTQRAMIQQFDSEQSDKFIQGFVKSTDDATKAQVELNAVILQGPAAVREYTLELQKQKLMQDSVARTNPNYKADSQAASSAIDSQQNAEDVKTMNTYIQEQTRLVDENTQKINGLSQGYVYNASTQQFVLQGLNEAVAAQNADNAALAKGIELDSDKAAAMRTAAVMQEQSNQKLTDANSIMEREKSTAAEFAGSFSDAFESILMHTTTWQKAMSDLFANLAKDIFNSFVKQAIEAPIESGLMKLFSGMPGLFGLGGGGASGVGGIGAMPSLWVPTLSAQGNIFGPNGLVAFASGGVVNSPTVFPFSNGVGLMGEAGPEAIMPLTRGPNGNLGVSMPEGMGQGGGFAQTNTIVVNVTATNTQDKQTHQQLANTISNQIQKQMDTQITAQIRNQMRPGGLLYSGGVKTQS
jgi:hypothetical protein